MSKHMKAKKPTDADLEGNPLIGGSKGARAAEIKPDDFDELAGENTVEGDVENDTTAAGGIRKSEARVGSPPRKR